MATKGGIKDIKNLAHTILRIQTFTCHGGAGGDVMTGGSANGADPSIIIGDGDTQGKGEDS
eukprot:scaffold264895_cov12-Tisochrysis_lutea.AAC.1